MKMPIFLTTSVFILLSCSTLKEKKKDPFCERVINFIENYWIYDSINNVYIFNTNDSLWFKDNFIFNEQNCWLGLTKRDIIKLFDKPSKSTDSTFEYYLNHAQNCFETTKACAFWEFTFDQKGKVSLATERFRVNGRIVY